jgi:hypothetical protein
MSKIILQISINFSFLRKRFNSWRNRIMEDFYKLLSNNCLRKKLISWKKLLQLLILVRKVDSSLKLKDDVFLYANLTDQC